MDKIIAVMNNKGGVLKTTLATNIAGVLVKQGKKVLLVDADPQGNVSSSFGTNSENLEFTLAEVLIDKIDVEKAIEFGVVPGLDILPTKSALNNFPAYTFAGTIQHEEPTQVLQNALNQVLDKYDYIIIDSAPYMDLTTVNVIKSADFIVIPAQMETYAAKGIVKLINDVQEIGGKVKYVVPTLFDERTNLHQTMLQHITDQVASPNDIKVTKTKITRSIKAATATAYERVPLVLTQAKTKQVVQYFDVVKEMGLL